MDLSDDEIIFFNEEDINKNFQKLYQNLPIWQNLIKVLEYDLQIDNIYVESDILELKSKTVQKIYWILSLMSHKQPKL